MHKQSCIILNFSCFCDNSFLEYNVTKYDCYTCPKKFGAAISLLLHAQYQHKQKIFRDSNNIQTTEPETSSCQDEFTKDNVTPTVNKVN